jgi:hypothetical protein
MKQTAIVLQVILTMAFLVSLFSVTGCSSKPHPILRPGTYEVKDSKQVRSGTKVHGMRFEYTISGPGGVYTYASRDTLRIGDKIKIGHN